MSDQDPTREHDKPVPKDPPAAVGTPGSRTDHDGPPPVHEEGLARQDAGQASEPIAPAHEPEPHETPD
ncbi:hypothetical protein ACIRVF_06560 [Kitasatospora sp. NPDC101157]|uniref:hypothetical protein n=1 Tax=Kitasatospora sp. NPDC101157 TaxID=3364098 RepID=UPI0038288B5C